MTKDAYDIDEEDEEQDWRELCERASKETDPETLMILADQINRALEQREHRLRQTREGTSNKKQDVTHDS